MNKLPGQHEALSLYLDALLAPEAKLSSPQIEGATADVGPMGAATVAQDHIDFMIVQVKDIRLAIRADYVKSVLPLPRVGVEHGEGTPASIKSVDRLPAVELRRVVFPQAHPSYADRSPYRYLVVLHTPAIALACDDVGKVVRVNNADVQWRRVRTGRPWLAGMIRGCECAVIDLVDEGVLAAIDSRH